MLMCNNLIELIIHCFFFLYFAGCYCHDIDTATGRVKDQGDERKAWRIQGD